VQLRCRTTHAKNLCRLGSSAAGFSTLRTPLAFSRRYTPFISSSAAAWAGPGRPWCNRVPIGIRAHALFATWSLFTETHTHHSGKALRDHAHTGRRRWSTGLYRACAARPARLAPWVCMHTQGSVTPQEGANEQCHPVPRIAMAYAILCTAIVCTPYAAGVRAPHHPCIGVAVQPYSDT